MMVDKGTLIMNLVCNSIITSGSAQSVEMACLHSPATELPIPLNPTAL